MHFSVSSNISLQNNVVPWNPNTSLLTKLLHKSLPKYFLKTCSFCRSLAFIPFFNFSSCMCVEPWIHYLPNKWRGWTLNVSNWSEIYQSLLSNYVSMVHCRTLRKPIWLGIAANQHYHNLPPSVVSYFTILPADMFREFQLDSSIKCDQKA